MKYIILAAFFLTGCRGKDTDIKITMDVDYDVQKLFTVEGCTVYRFEDRDFIYFTNCGETTWKDCIHNGKNRTCKNMNVK